MRRKSLRRFWRRLPALAFAISAMAVTGCEDDEIISPSLRPGWSQNMEFHLETRYKHVNMRTERGDSSTSPEATEADEIVDLGDRWSEAVYWRYQVIHNNFEPDENDDFYEFFVKGGTESPLTVIKASLDPALNLESELVEADPKIYMVIREDRLRMAGLVYFYTLNGERIHDAVSVDDEEMNRSFNRLSQTNLSIIPHFVPPFPILPEDADLELEDGSEVNFTNASGTSVDVMYENSLDNTLITDTWEDGQPWAVWSVTPTMDSRLMDPAEVDELAGPLRGLYDGEDDPEDFDFIRLLRDSVNLSHSLDVDDVLRGTQRVRDGFVPWAGYWYAQAEGDLIWGHLSSNNDTPSELAKTTFQGPATDIQNLGEELRNLRRDGQGSSDEYNEKVQEYRDKQNELTEALVKFYNELFQGMRVNKIRVEGDNLVADADWSEDHDAFSFAVDRMSPLDKFAMLQTVEGHLHGTNPWFGPAWEILNHWSPAGSGWWGHCNGWAAAAILTDEPRATHNVEFGNGDDVDLNVGDMKGLLSETYYGTMSNFFGARYNGDDGEDISDLSPKAVLQLLDTYIGKRGVPFVFDVTAGDQVWNYPAYEYDLTLTETSSGVTEESGGLININTAGVAELDTLWGISEVRASRVIAYREAHGPFQATEDIIRVNGIGRGIFNRIAEQITVSVSTQLRTFDGALTVRFADDAVQAGHVDNTEGQPVTLTRNWPFELSASPAGEIISGKWDDDEDGHPDFAWVPYGNPLRSGRSENGYLQWQNLEDYLPEGIVRQ